MGLFSTNKVNKAQISPLPEPSVQAAVGNSYSRQNAAPNMIGSWYTYQAGQARNRAISVPAISRSRDLMASVLANMGLEMCTEIWDGNEMEKVVASRYAIASHVTKYCTEIDGVPSQVE